MNDLDVDTKARKELEANMFAFELLMPEKDIRKQVSGKAITPMFIEKLAERYGVEPMVVSLRLGQLMMEPKL